jgi:hypothetical protein
MTQNELILSNLLNRACEIITSLEGYANEHPNYPKDNRELQKEVDDFFNEVDVWDDTVLQKAVDGYDADMEAQDYDIFGENKI